MSLRILTLFGLGILCWTVSVVADDDTVPTQEQLTFFETKIRPVLIASCYECHASDAKIIQGGLRLDSRAGLLKGDRCLRDCCEGDSLLTDGGTLQYGGMTDFQSVSVKVDGLGSPSYRDW